MMPRPGFPYQDEGSDWLASRTRAGIFDEPGAGKTQTLIMTCDKLRAVRIIVICPAAVREAWLTEFLEVQQYPRRVCKGVTIHDFVAWFTGAFDVLVTSYEQMAKWASRVIEAGMMIGVIIIDEGHYLKEPSTARARAFLGENSDGVGALLQWSLNAYWATGSPIPNDPLDIFTFLRTVNAVRCNRSVFSKRFFSSRERAYGSTQQAKTDMLPELRQIIGSVSIRRRLADVGYQLPAIFLTQTVVDGDTTEIHSMLREHPGIDKAIINAMEEGGSLAKIDSDSVSTIRRLVGEAKALPYAQMLLGELDGGKDKVLVFGIHRAALSVLMHYMGKHGVRAGLIDGHTKEADRVSLVRSFQQEKSMRVLALNIRAGGVGLTLTAAGYVDMMESDWSPAANAQALKRAHRLGQTKIVRARFITLANSFDTVVNKIVAEKTAKIAAIEGEAMLGAAPELAA